MCCATWTSTFRPTWPRCCRWWRRCCRATATSRSAPGFTARPACRRGIKRELISRSYNRLLRLALRVRFSDAQCGFKAIRGDVAHGPLEAVQDEAWFFDTELLVLAQRRGLRIHEVPVDWVEDTDSRVEILPTALADLRGVARLLFRRPSDRLTLVSPRRPMLAP